MNIPKSSLHKHLTVLRGEGLIEYRRTITTIIGVRTVVKKYLELVNRLNHVDKH